MDLPVSSFVCHSSLLIAKGVDLAVARDRLPFEAETVRIFLSGYRGAFQAVQPVLDLYCCERDEHSQQRSVMDTSLFRRLLI